MSNYYPNLWSGCEPIHPVVSWCYVRKIVRARLKGEEVPPILIEGGLGNGFHLNGTHRSAANDILVMLDEDGRLEGCLDDYLIGYEIYDDGAASDELREAVQNSDYETIDAILDRED